MGGGAQVGRNSRVAGNESTVERQPGAPSPAAGGPRRGGARAVDPAVALGHGALERGGGNALDMKRKFILGRRSHSGSILPVTKTPLLAAAAPLTRSVEPTPSAEPSRLLFGRCELRVDTRELWVSGTRKPVRRRVFDLMVHLIRRRPGVVRHDDLMRAVWQRSDVSQSVLARAVMEARQACGEAADAPRFFVSLHGVGYRFAGEVRPDAVRDPPSARAGDDADAAIVEVRAMVRNARRAVAEQRLEEAQRLAEDAMAKAQDLGVQSENVRALLVCASVATHRKRMTEAARLANHALQIAVTEGQPPLIAEARLAVGAVHALAGDRAIGIDNLRAAMEALSAPGHEAELTRCLNWLSRALRDQGDLEAALDLCRQRVALTARCQGQAFTRLDRLDELQLLAELGDRLMEAGDERGAREHFEAGLAVGRSLMVDLAAPELAADRAACLDHLSVLLERLGRVAEAWGMAEACDAQRQRLPDGVTWPDVEDRPRFRMQRARLVSHAGGIDAVLVEVDDILAEASTAPASEGQADLYRLAADIAGRGGAHEHASRWLRRQCEVLATVQRGRGASLATILAAELDADSLRGELERARSETRDVLVENAELRRRVRQLEDAFALAPQTGLAAQDHLDELFGPALDRARVRGLPMCIGVLQLAASARAAGVGHAETVASYLRRAAEALAAHPDVARPAFDMGGGRVAFHVRDAGLARAQAVCDEIIGWLAGRDRLRATCPPAVHWDRAAADAVGFGSLRACVRWLALPRTERPQSVPPTRLETELVGGTFSSGR